jgi:hypothetical protein
MMLELRRPVGEPHLARFAPLMREACDLGLTEAENRHVRQLPRERRLAVAR